ncbi:hypothetical protein H9Q73_009252 [Fusarium xylarioides]|nr:hypothetical protein H9Q73_009252 [Fusarium xylarioides]
MPHRIQLLSTTHFHYGLSTPRYAEKSSYKSTYVETRGCKKLLSEDDKDKLEKLYDKEGFEAKRLSWTNAAIEAGIETEVSTDTVRTAAASRGLYKRIARQIQYKSDADCQAREAWARKELAKRPEPEDWHNVIFTDECHWGFGDEARQYIERKPPTDKDLKRVHGWGGIGWDFKSDLHLYDISSNSNGKMTQTYYLDNILKPFVHKLRQEGRYFVLEEDNDSGHGPGKNNPVRS